MIAARGTSIALQARGKAMKFRYEMVCEISKKKREVCRMY
jgi:hypothetical protein